MNTAKVILVVLCVSADAQSDSVRQGFLKLQATKARIVPMPMYQYPSDCGAEAHLRIKAGASALLQQGNVPGAGITKFKPFEKVLKDGFLAMDCVKDYMYYRGDKFGDNKHDYKLGGVSDVSIVHYDAFIAKEDRVEMTPTVCFEFCRTVPNMGFFGIVNGRSCYCTPYTTSMESDSSQCDAVCEGQKTLTCGGKSKSSIFAMHMCASTKDDLGQRYQETTMMYDILSTMHRPFAKHGKYMDHQGANWQSMFGGSGDSGMANLCQALKVYGGKMIHAAEDAKALMSKIDHIDEDTYDMLHARQKAGGRGRDFTDPEVVTKAERLMENMDEVVAQGEQIADVMSDMFAASNYGQNLATKEEVRADCEEGCGRGTRVKTGASKQYYEAMYFVDKEFRYTPMTCSGPLVGPPILTRFGGTTDPWEFGRDACATACDDSIHECVGYQVAGSMCWLFSRFDSGFYYTGCNPSLYSTGGKDYAKQNYVKSRGDEDETMAVQCFAKLSKFEGTSLKPNPSGKCDQCFKTLTKADRCFEWVRGTGGNARL